MEVMQILCIDKFAGKIEIRGIKNNDVMVDQLSLTLL
jgi:hypothetical protein